MSDTPQPELEQQLSELTTWRGRTPNLWQRALTTAAPPTGRARLPHILRRPIPAWVPVTVGAAVIFIGVAISMTQMARLQGIRPGLDIGGGVPIGADLERLVSATEEFEPEFLGGLYRDIMLDGLRHNSDGRGGKPARAAGEGGRGRGGILQGGRALPAEPDSASSSPVCTALDRQVIRKATIELRTDDVRATFLKATLLLSEAQSEFVQQSGLTGTGREVQGSLTLRVAVDRLSQVLNELRQLGEVQAESSIGEDVTSQVVDLEARLRNEQRVETELLQLLEKRADAPLKEILELRRSIGEVRQNIECLTAQRERLSRLVALATVLVIIRPTDAPEPEPEPGLGAYLSGALGNAGHKGLLFLINTLAAILSILIGGLIWWLLLVAAILLFRVYRRRGSTSTP